MWPYSNTLLLKQLYIVLPIDTDIEITSTGISNEEKCQCLTDSSHRGSNSEPLDSRAALLYIIILCYFKLHIIKIYWCKIYFYKYNLQELTLNMTIKNIPAICISIRLYSLTFYYNRDGSIHLEKI